MFADMRADMRADMCADMRATCADMQLEEGKACELTGSKPLLERCPIEVRSAFFRKVYLLPAEQLLLTAAVATVALYDDMVNAFVVETPEALVAIVLPCAFCAR